MSRPPDLVAPENDYRSLRPRPGPDGPTISVVIPAHGRPDALAHTLNGLLPQLGENDEAVVVDDGSDPPLTEVPTGVTLLRQERDGFGLAKARNLGWRHSSGEVMVFLDSDTIPGADFLARHRAWHATAANLVVVSLRHHVDASASPPDKSGGIRPESLPRVHDDVAGIVGDWRVRFARRAALLTLGDEAFRAGVGNNMSVRRDRLDEVGGFDEAFRSWGGEDTEFVWRLWNAGSFLIPEREAAVFHQVEPGERRGWRVAARSRNLALVADRVPHRFYRPTPHPLATVPKLTWVAVATGGEEIDTVWRRVTATPFPDAELIWVAMADAGEQVSSLQGEAARIKVAGTVTEAVLAASGEILCFLDGRVRFNAGVVAKAVGRLDGTPRASVVRLPYRLGADVYRRFDDLAAIDAAFGPDGAPMFALARRREIAKDRVALTDPVRWWPGTLDRSRIVYLPGDAVTVAMEGPRPPERPGSAEAAAAGPVELARLVVGRARRSSAASERPEAPPATDSDLVPIDYVGFTEHNNLGDDAIQVALRRLMPWADIGRDKDDAACLMLGGGTLVNGNRYYLTRILRRDSPSLERAVFGVGVRDPDFHGVTEPMEEWWRFFDSSLQVGVRGPSSVDHLRGLGYDGEVEILGDPALSLESPHVDVDVDQVVVCPVWTSGNLMGGDDRAVFDALSGLIGRLVSEGRKVTMMSAFPNDDRHILELMRHAGHPDLDYFAGYDDVDESMRILAGAGIVVAERLHAAILAAAAGRPFIGLEYWPKHRDFARSLDLEELVVSTSGLDASSLGAHFDAIDGRREDIAARIVEAVAGFRKLQTQAADGLRQDIARG